MLPSITAQPKQKLTKEQESFNKLTKKIQKLQLNIKQQNEEMESMLAFYAAEVYPLEQQILSHRKAIAPLLFGFLDKSKAISKSEHKTLRQLLSNVLDTIFSELREEPDANLKEIFQYLHEVSYDQAAAEDFEESKAEMKDFFASMGMKVNLDDLNQDDGEEAMARKMAEMQQKMREEAEAKFTKKANKKKTAKQLQAEEQAKQVEELRKKSINAIYRQLVKAIHPDLEQDETLRKEKEGTMAQLTIAYQNNDLPTLLKLEMQWLQKESNHLETLSDDKLKLYNQILKEQTQELEEERYMLARHPRFNALSKFISPFAGLVSTKVLWMEKERLKASTADIERSLNHLRSENALAELKDIIRTFKDAVKSHQRFRDDDF
jgi:hypothetical protein